MKQFPSKGITASQLRRRKYELVRSHSIPEELLGGSLCRSRRRCGKANCRCAHGEGHPGSSLTFSHRGQRRVERIPECWVEDIEQAVVATQAHLDAIGEVMAINLSLLTLAREQAASKRRTSVVKNRKKSSKNDQP